jgi:predicted transcriptional regulator
MKALAAFAVILVLILIVLPAGAAETTYTVRSARGSIPDGPSMDPIPVEWWQIPFRIYLTRIILHNAPEFLVIINLLFLVNVRLFFGYRRIAKQVALEHETRTAIYNHIIARPGIHFNALARDLETNRGTMKYHLRNGSTKEILSILLEGQGASRRARDHRPLDLVAYVSA